MLAAIERHPVLTVLVIAAIIRTVVAGVVAMFSDGSLFLDDASYSQMAAARAGGLDRLASRQERVLYDQTATFLVPVTVLYRIFGPVVLLGQLVAVAFGAATAAVVTRIALEMVGARAALFAGLTVALLPSQILWSSLTLKDAGVWLTGAGLGLTVAVAGRLVPRRLVFAGLAALVLLLLLGHLRLHTTVISSWALVLTGWVGQRTGRLLRAGGAVALALVAPLLLGLGPGGWDLVTRAGPFSERRSLNAAGALTAVEDSLALSKGSDLEYLPRGLSVMLLEPYPWSPTRTAPVRLAKFETLLWYPLLALAAAGIPSVWARRRVLLFPAVLGGGILLVYALSEGNLGTAFRHRSELVWPLALLAAAGLSRVGLIRPPRPSPDPTEA